MIRSVVKWETPMRTLAIWVAACSLAHAADIRVVVEPQSARKPAPDFVLLNASGKSIDEMKRRLPINRRDGPDVIFAGAPLTATGGHPSALHRDMLKTGAFPGYTSDRLKDHTYFVIDS